MSVDIFRRISDGTNMSATFINYFGKAVDWELLGTTVAENIDGQGKNQFLAHVRISGTPLLAVIPPIVSIILIVAGVYLVITFRKAIDATVTNVGTVVGQVGTTVENLGLGIEDAVKSTGTGLKYALPIVAVGVSVLAVILLFGYGGLKVR
jgi:hypothetical protein